MMHSIFLRRITSHTGRMRPVGLKKRSFAVCFGDQLSHSSLSGENKIYFPLETHGVHSGGKGEIPAYHQLDVTSSDRFWRGARTLSSTMYRGFTEPVTVTRHRSDEFSLYWSMSSGLTPAALSANSFL